MRTTLLLLSLALPATAQSTARSDAPLLTAGPTLRAHTGLVRCLTFGPEGTLATGGQGRLLCLWDGDGKLVRRVDLRPGGG